MYQSPDKNSNKHADKAASDLAELIERLEQANNNPAQLLDDLLAIQCLLGLADSGAILRLNQEKNVDVLALYPRLDKGASAPEWLRGSVGFVRDAFQSDKVLTKALD